jgi:hypothetical protein
VGAHPRHGRTRNHAGTATNIEQTGPVNSAQRVEHFLGPLAKQRWHKELFVNIGS